MSVKIQKKKIKERQTKTTGQNRRQKRKKLPERNETET